MDVWLYLLHFLSRFYLCFILNIVVRIVFSKCLTHYLVALKCWNIQNVNNEETQPFFFGLLLQFTRVTSKQRKWLRPGLCSPNYDKILLAFSFCQQQQWLPSFPLFLNCNVVHIFPISYHFSHPNIHTHIYIYSCSRIGRFNQCQLPAWFPSNFWHKLVRIESNCHSCYSSSAIDSVFTQNVSQKANFVTLIFINFEWFNKELNFKDLLQFLNYSRMYYTNFEKKLS